jgi:hypothetical protein
MSSEYDPDDPVVGDEQVVEGDAALAMLEGFRGQDCHRHRLWAALSTPKHAHQLHDEIDDGTGIAHTYRGLNQLTEAGLIEEVDPIPADRDPDAEKSRRPRTYYRRVHDQLTFYVRDDAPCLVLSERPPYDPKRRLDEVNRDV